MTDFQKRHAESLAIMTTENVRDEIAGGLTKNIFAISRVALTEDSLQKAIEITSSISQKDRNIHTLIAAWESEASLAEMTRDLRKAYFIKTSTLSAAAAIVTAKS